MLTARQAELLAFIASEIRRTGIAPSYRQMQAHLGLASVSTISELLSCLEERGFIRRAAGRARGIEVIRQPAPPPTTSDLLRRIAEHFGPALAGLRADCLDPDAGETDADLLAFIEGGEALLAEARSIAGGA